MLGLAGGTMFPVSGMMKRHWIINSKISEGERCALAPRLAPAAPIPSRTQTKRVCRARSGFVRIRDLAKRSSTGVQRRAEAGADHLRFGAVGLTGAVRRGSTVLREAFGGGRR